MMIHSKVVVLVVVHLSWWSSSSFVPPPLPILPIPTAAQLQWQQGEMALFLHLGPNTFTDSEWGSGHADPSVFNPSALDARQWASVAKSNAFARLVLTAKHHDGFCLFPSLFTNYSVRSSPWRDGQGDVLADLSSAAHDAGLGFGVYLSPWDRHEPSYGQTIRYNQYYLGQMGEVLSRYGRIDEVWLDGAKGEGEKDMDYLFDCWFHVIHQLQPGAVIFSDAGPDTRWIGDEAGVAASTCWSLFNKTAVTIGHTDDRYSQEGDPHGVDWVPAECDVSIRPGWFWHKSEHPKSAAKLLDIYYKSVGRNCLLILNVPPNSSGLISEQDIQVLQEFTQLRTSIFSHNLAEGATVTANSVRGGLTDNKFSPSNVLEQGIHTYWAPEEGRSNAILQLDFGHLISFNVLQVQEPIQMGQRVIKFQIEVLELGEWKTIAEGTTIGYKRILQFPKVEAQFLKLNVTDSRAIPLIAYIGVHIDLFNSNHEIPKTNSSFNGNRVIRLARSGNQSMMAVNR